VPEEKEDKDQAKNRTADTQTSTTAALPTPGLAEGDEETIDEDIKQKLDDEPTQGS
jgi:hypothetical protein